MGKPFAEVNLLSETENDLPRSSEEVGDTKQCRMTCHVSEMASVVLTIKGNLATCSLYTKKRTSLVSSQSHVPSCKKVRSFLTTGNSGMMGGCMLWLLSTLRYLDMFLDGSKTSCRSLNSFSYLLGSFSQEFRRRATGAKFRPLREGGKRRREGGWEKGGSRVGRD